MQMFLYILAAVIFFGLTDLIPAIREKNRKYVYVYIGFTTAILVVWVLLAKDVQIPGPNDAIRAAVQAIVGPLE